MLNRNSTFILMGLLVAGWAAPASSQEVRAQLNQVGDAVSLEFQGQKNWNYKIQREGQTVVLRLAGVPPKSLLGLRSWKGPLISKVKIDPGVDGGSDIRFEVQTSDVDAFDYLSDQPNRLIVDFFRRPKDEHQLVSSSKVPSPKEIEKKTKPKAAQNLPNQLPKKGDETRRPASGEFLKTAEGETQVSAPAPAPADYTDEVASTSDGADPDFSRFIVRKFDVNEESIISSRNNIFLRFPPLRSGTNLLQDLVAAPPIYEIKPVKADPENEKARLLLTLFQNKRYTVFLKTQNDFFEKEFPESRYKEIVRYMEADSYYELWRKSKNPADYDQAMSKYRVLTEAFPKSPLRERTQLIVGFSLFERGDYFNALQAFERFLRDNPQSKYRNPVKIAMAKNYVGLKDFKRAYGVMNQLEQDSSAAPFNIEASFQKGDIAFDQKDFGVAAADYAEAMKKNPGAIERYPNASYNIAESNFWLGNYETSLAQYVDFLKRFGRHDHAGYAMARVGELLEILGAPERQIAGAFLETMFRYNETEGAGVARVRLLARRMPAMKEKEIGDARKSIDEFLSRSTLPRAVDFVTLMLSDGYDRRSEHEKALDLLIGFYQSHPSSDMDSFRVRILKNISKLIEREVDSGHFMKALDVYGKYASVWLKSSPRIDVDYNLGRAFEQGGVPGEASEYYKKALNRLYSIRGTDVERVTRVQQNLPTPESLNLRLAAMAASQKDYGRSERYLQAVGAGNQLSNTERVEKASLIARLEEERGNFKRAKSALQELVAHWKGHPKEVSAPYLRLAQLDFKAKDHKSSQDYLEKILTLDRDSQEVSEDILVKALELSAENHAALKNLDESILTYRQLLEKYESTHPMESARYRLGGLLFQKGDLTTAEKEWGKLKGDSIWARLASEQLLNAKWQDDHKKYINRIPAMVSGDKNERNPSR